MYTVKYEEYVNDFTRRTYSKQFGSLKSIEDWIFDQMQQSYERMWFPTKEPYRIEFTPTYGGPNIWIYMITSERGIEFTEGRFTDGQKHWSNSVRDWLVGCNKRKKAPQFVFAE